MGVRNAHAPRINCWGYRLVYAPDHPHARMHGERNAKNWVAEHIKVALEAVGHSRLGEGEMVHHINLDKTDNRSENLVITDRATHSRWHRQLEQIGLDYLRRGLTTFHPCEGYRRVDCAA